MTNLLEASDLAVGRGGVSVLSGLNLSLSSGDALVLQGPNGAGKTTLLRNLAGFLEPISGRYIADDPAFAGHLDGVKAQLTVTENLRFWAEIHGTSDISVALDRFDLSALKDRPARALSAGQKRRLGLARLMLTGRRLWLLDEPTVSLDRASVARFAEVVRDHLSSGGAALIATHTDLGLDAPVLDLGPFRSNRRASAAENGGATSVSHPEAIPPRGEQPRRLSAASLQNAAPNSTPGSGAEFSAEVGPTSGKSFNETGLAGQESRPTAPQRRRDDPFGAGW